MKSSRIASVGLAVAAAFVITLLPQDVAAQGATPPPSPTPAVVQLLNISGRVSVQTNDGVGIGGFILQPAPPPSQAAPSPGPVRKQVIIRGLGPSLKVNGVAVPGTIQDPTLELYDASGALVAMNDNWRSTQEMQIEATGLAPTDDRESAIIAELEPGQYTAIIRGAGNTTGIGLLELYDLQPATLNPLTNLSVRGKVETGDDVLIGGIIANGGNRAKILFRAIGPDLAADGVMNPLNDPTLQLYDTNGDLLASNDNWKDTQEQEIAATGIPPNDDRDSAILQILPSANYTVVVRGKSNGNTSATGVAIVEAYNLGPVIP